jgi:hypothetical protein
MEAEASSKKRGADEGIWIEVERRQACIGASGESASE